MKKLLLFLLAFLAFQGMLKAQSQYHLSAHAATTEEDYENVKVQKLQEDEHTTSFIIWVKQGVKAHKHVEHSEQIYVISGRATMELGEKSFDIQTGDYIFIPKNTRHAVKVTSEEPLKVLSIQTPKFLGKDRVWLD
jgi:mannose-6-phosphate isomerase-like protein (cupin superfamily)